MKSKSTATHLLKAFMPVEFRTVGQKALDGTTELKDGQWIATAAVFGNVDSYGDVVMPGAFTDDIAAWKSSGNSMSAIYSHDWMDPFANIGTVLDMQETAVGFQYMAEADMDEPLAAKVYRLMKSRRVVQQSFSYDILDAGMEIVDGESQFQLRKLHVFEVGPCLVGVNQETDLLAIKAEKGRWGATPTSEPTSQGKSAAADVDSTPPGSAPETSASKGFATPASAMLAIDIQEFLGGIDG